MRRNLTMDMANKGSPNRCQSWVSWGGRVEEDHGPWTEAKNTLESWQLPVQIPWLQRCKA